MNSCEARRYATAQDEMKQVYKEILVQFKAQHDFVGKLSSAQLAWVKFRDADVESFYYANDKLAAYGSVYPMCRSLYLIQFTNERTRELRAILSRRANDVCGFEAVAAATRVGGRAVTHSASTGTSGMKCASADQ